MKVAEIKLTRRYPHSRIEDITDAFMRGERLGRESMQAENDKLREELEQWHRLTAGIKLPEYPITEFKPKDLERENAKLRELVRFIMHQCNDGNPRCDECISWNDGECVALLRMRELGLEVDE